MAISKNYNFRDIIISNAYFRIDNLNGNKNGINIILGIYSNKDSSKAIETKLYTFVPNVLDNSKNFIKQGYEYLKTLDEFKDAVDLLDEGQTL
jgi:hypothetical protein